MCAFDSMAESFYTKETEESLVEILGAIVKKFDLRLLILSGLFFAACSTTRTTNQPPEAAKAQETGPQLTESHLALLAKIEELENKLRVAENQLAEKGTTPAVVATPLPPAATGPEDKPEQLFRKGHLLVEAKQFPEAILSHSSFLDRYPNHLLAGQAQFEVSRAYEAQGQCVQAATEALRVRDAYPTSPYVPDALGLAAFCKQKLGNHSIAENLERELVSLYPSSPAAGRIAAKKPKIIPTERDVLPTTPNPTKSSPDQAAPVGFDEAPE